jgi:hypothetical protein
MPPSSYKNIEQIVVFGGFSKLIDKRRIRVYSDADMQRYYRNVFNPGVWI